MKPPLFLVLLFSVSIAVRADFLPSDATPVGANVPGVTDYEVPIFSDSARCNYYGWTDLPNPPLTRAQLSKDGYPLVVPAGAPAVSSRLFNGTLHPESKLTTGLYTLNWKGTADIRLAGYVGSQTSGTTEGMEVDGTRTYLFKSISGPAVTVHQIDPRNPITSIKVMMPDPAAPESRSIDPGVTFHPSLLQHLREGDWAFIRTMDFTVANGNPQKEWSDRLRPDYFSQIDTGNGTPAEPYVLSGSAWEYAVVLANEANKNLWICIPYMASDDYITKLSQLVCFGGDGVNPYRGPVAKPVWAPLNPKLKVYLEYSNEVWNLGFIQNTWAAKKGLEQYKDGTEVGVGRVVGRRDCDIWSLFQKTFGGSDRLVRVAGGSVAFTDYSKSVLDEIKADGPKEVPPTKADVTETAPYFQYSIPEWAAKQNWFGAFARSGFLPPEDLTAALSEWDRAMLADAYNSEDKWPLVTGDVPLICYEGGPDPTFPIWQFPDAKVSAAAGKLGAAMQVDPRIKQIYSNWVNMTRAEGMRIFGMYTLSGAGPFSHLLYLDEPVKDAPKYQVMLDWLKEASGMQFIDMPKGKPPAFVTPKALPPAQIGQPYSQTITTEGGNGARKAKVIDLFSAVPGLTATATGDTIQLTGTPQGSGNDGGMDYIHARVMDDAGNPAWRVFGIPLYGGAGTLVNCDFQEKPAAGQPWTKTRILAPGLTFSGWKLDTGGVAQEEPRGFGFHTMNGLAPIVTEEEAKSGNHGITSTLTSLAPLDLRHGTVQFTFMRINNGSAVQVALYASVNGGPMESTPIFDLAEPLWRGDVSEESFAGTIPNTADYQAVKSIQFFIYTYGDYWSGPAALTGFQASTADCSPKAPNTK